ncbi:hypothetical protein [Peterkaempfera bronchialis]|uniref:hypothetical protein n=1 Tax=Peterkaempfera bronchialis TaxID=2126346 RepID=UPI003C2EA27F
MAVHGGAPDPVQVDDMRMQLDEMLRARQYAVQRERRLAAELRSAGHRYAAPPAGPDPEAARQLAQARAYREQLGAECLRLSEQLRGVEAQARWNGASPPPPGEAEPEAEAPIDVEIEGDLAPEARVEPEPGPAAGRRTRPRRAGGARHGGAAADRPIPEPPAEVPEARDGRDRPVAGERPMAGERPGSDAEAARQQPWPIVDPVALAARVSGMHAAGQGRQAVAAVAEAALSLAPADVAALAAELHTEGPSGSAGYLARAAAGGTADHAAQVLSLLRQAELTEEAQELFHQLWSWPPDRLPPLFAALERTGQAADAATLLWESASAPADEVAALVGALADAGRDADLRSLLGQTASRAAPEVADLVRALADAGRESANEVLLRTLVRGRQPGDLARLGSVLMAEGRPEVYGRLLAAAEETAPERRRDIASALRLAGLPLHVPASSGRNRLGRRSR